MPNKMARLKLNPRRFHPFHTLRYRNDCKHCLILYETKVLMENINNVFALVEANVQALTNDHVHDVMSVNGNKFR